MTSNPEQGSWTLNPPSVVQQVHALIDGLRGSPGRKRLMGLAIGLMVVIAATAIAQLWLNAWNKPFFDAVERRDLDAFGFQLIVFAVIASTLLVLNVAQTWLDQTTKVEMRLWLTRDLLLEWMIPKRAFLIAGTGDIGINPDQRIHEDARRLTELSTALAIGFFQSTLLLLSFIGVLWVLSEGFVLEIAGRSILVPGFMVWCALIYAASGSWLSWWVGQPLVEIGAARYAREADLRFALVRVSESTDGISLYGGEAGERQRLDRDLEQVTQVMRKFVRGLARMTWITAGYGWFAIVAPILIAAPGYFSGHLTFGELMMTVGAFNQVQQALRWFVDNASSIADWRAALLRVMSFRQALLAMDQIKQPYPRIDVVENSKSLMFNGVAVCAADREIGLDEERVEIKAGEHVLIIGKPGIGKSMFFRAIAGLWPWGRGQLAVPSRVSMMFLPQRPYIAAGSVRDVLAYPSAPSDFSDADFAHALERTNLGHLIPLLDHTARWDKKLTADEHKHLAFARLLVHRPEWIVSDEAISHLNEDDRRILLSLFERELAKAAVVSITSNDAQHAFYTRSLHLIARPVSRSNVGMTRLSNVTIPADNGASSKIARFQCGGTRSSARSVSGMKLGAGVDKMIRIACSRVVSGQFEASRRVQETSPRS